MQKEKCFLYYVLFYQIKDTWCLIEFLNFLLPTTLSKKVLEKGKVAISDTVSQEFLQFDFFIKNYMINAFCVRCGWYLVDWGWIHQWPKFQTQDALCKN